MFITVIISFYTKQYISLNFFKKSSETFMKIYQTINFIYASLGLLLVNNLYLYWQFFQFDFSEFLSNTIGIALFIEVFGLMILLSLYFKKYHSENEKI